MMYLRVKNWDQFQHYKQRCPPWIKLHREILNDYAFTSLPDVTKAHLLLIWALAAGTDGLVPYDARFIASRIAASDPVDLDAIVAAGFLIAEEGPDLPAMKGNGTGIDHAVRAEKAERKAAAIRILHFLNEKSGKSFREVESNLAPIMARLQDFDEITLRSIVIHRHQLWGADEKMAEYLRPNTLFNASKCAAYAGEIEAHEQP